jgi:GT2 family glycosyltransferase
VCIVNWNTIDLLRNCLDSIFRQTWRVTLQIIVVDNASTDGSAAMVRDEFPQVELIANSENVGFARANNQAFGRARGRYVLMLNSDTVILPSAFDTMAEFMDSHPPAGATGCKLLNADGSLQRSCWRGFPSLRMAVVDAFYLWRLMPGLPWVRTSEYTEQELQDTLEVDHLLGACMLVRREIIEQVGGMDESLFLFLEETEWCYRIKSHGWKIYFLPTAQIIHVGQQSTRQNPERTMPEKYRNYVWFYRKYQKPSRVQVTLLKAIISLGGLVGIALWVWRSREVNRRELARHMRRGYWNVVQQAWSF